LPATSSGILVLHQLYQRYLIGFAVAHRIMHDVQYIVIIYFYNRIQPRLHGEAVAGFAQIMHELYPEGAQANVQMAQDLVEKGRLQEARQHLEKALQTERRSQALLFLYARLLLDMDEDPQKVRQLVDELRR
jgi:predicted negative regulator of RcsB-dependent stress response